MLPQRTSELWERYLAAEEIRIRSELLEALDSFIESLHELPEEVRFEWARGFAAEHLDSESAFPIRMPLFRRVLFPALAAGLAARTPGCARWMGRLGQLLYKCPDLHRRVSPPNATPKELFRTALIHDPGDTRAREALLEALAWELDYSIHEVPYGVLARQDCAPAEALGELRQKLDEFTVLAERQGSRERYASLIEACDFHFREYESYLAQRDQFDSYESFLDESHPEGWPRE